MLETFSNFELINREGNKVADKLALMGSSLPFNSKIYTKYDLRIPYQIAELIEQEKHDHFKKESNLDDGEGSTSGIAKNIGVAGAVAGVAMLAAWGVSKLFSGEGSSDKNEHTNMFKTPGSYDRVSYNNNFGTERFFILHFHGSDSNQTEKAASGCIIRDKQCKLLVAAAYNISDQYPHCHIAIAEAVALRNGLKLAKDHNVKLDLILGDNDEVINRVNGIQTKLPRVETFTQIIQEIMRGLYEQSVATKTKVQSISCDNNKVAHKLASVGATLYSGQTVTYTREQELPVGVAELIRQDQLSSEIFK